MRYDSPELRERLAAEYVLGTLPARARRRFERLIAADPTLARLVGEWAARLAPLDETARAEAPPARVWLAIERQIGGGEAATSAEPWYRSLAWWRGLTSAAGAAAAALAIYIGVSQSPAPAPTVVAVLAGHGGEPGWVAIAGPKKGEIVVAAAAPGTRDTAHAFELWGISGGGRPRPLGLLPQRPGPVLAVPVAELPPVGGALAVSLEPPGGSPTGSPTGPVLYQGKVLAHSG